MPEGPVLMIPTICHFIWFAGDLPRWAQTNLQSFVRHNPKIKVRLHTDATLLHAGYREAWERADHPATRSDMLRYSILEELGGIYFDLDWYHISPLPEPVDDGTLQCVEIVPRVPVNAAMACAPGLPVFAELQRRFLGQGMTYMAGSHALTIEMKRNPRAISQLAGTWCPSLWQNVDIYCHAHGVAVPAKEATGEGPYTAVHLSTAGAITDDDHEARARWMYYHLKCYDYVATNLSKRAVSIARDD